MPIYEYRCSNGHTFEVFQSMADDPVSECEECGAPVERVYRPVAVHYKGSGFYTTDYAKKGAAKSATSEPSKSDGDSSKSSDSSPSSSDSKKSDSKSETKSSTSKSSSD